MNGVEKQILRKLCEGLMAEGYWLTVDYEMGFDSEPENRNMTNINDIIKAADAVDECWLMADREELDEGPYDAFVTLIWGNGNEGRDCISDYCISLEPIIKPIYDWIEGAELCLK
jgi:hypothetical protein